MEVVGFIIGVPAGILILKGVWEMLKYKPLRKIYLLWFVIIFVILSTVFLTITGFTKDVVNYIAGTLILTLMLSLLASYIHKEILGRKYKEPTVEQMQKWFTVDSKDNKK